MLEKRQTAEAEIGLTDEVFVELAGKHGTPLYVYDMARLRARVSELRNALDPVQGQLFFATMANDQPRVLRTLADLHVGGCVNSLPHLDLAMRAGFSTESIQFTSTGISVDDMRALQALGVRTNFDSLAQLEAWFKLGGQKAGVRVNAASLGLGLPEDRIGIEAERVGDATDLAARLGGELEGLHIYVGTNFQSPAQMLPTLEAFFDLAASVAGLSYVNIGGGIGVNYKRDGARFDVFSFGHGLAGFARRLRERLGRNLEVIMEPGRGLVAECAVFLTSVTDVKRLAGRRFAAVDASVSIFPRPFYHPDTPHRIRKVCKGPVESVDAPDNATTMIVGRTTFSRDILGSCYLRQLGIGDLLAIEDAGAYSQSMASRFLGQREPHVVFVDETRAFCARTLDDDIEVLV